MPDVTRPAASSGEIIRAGAADTGRWYPAFAMPEFVIERDIPGAGNMTEAEIRDVSIRSLEVLGAMGPQIQWLHSYVTDDRIYCVYLAPDEASVREHAQKLGVPANRVSAVRRLIDPKKYAGV